MFRILLYLFLVMCFFSVYGQKVIQGKLKDNILLNSQTQDYLYNKVYLFGANTEREPSRIGYHMYEWTVLDSSIIDKNSGKFVLKNPMRFEKELCLIAFTKEAIKYGAYRGIVLLRNAP
ncbi:MAG: hypothetical protein RML94_15925, partial [Bacteroidia bacterium]|nr:hypothetical protein [Bacteroidia bacterium]